MAEDQEGELILQTKSSSPVPQDEPLHKAQRNGKKTPKSQLSKGMEHMRYAVTVPGNAASALSGDTPLASESEEPAYGVPTYYQPVRRPQTDAANNDQKRRDPFQFGSRYLEEGDDIFAYNAWDHVETDAEYQTFIDAQTALQRDSPVSDYDKKRFNDKPEKWWDKFYSNNKANFFKDRKWLVQEFPILGKVTEAGYGPATVLEVGAGAGNTAFPVLAMNKNDELRLHACDYSKAAVKVMRESELYDKKFMRADVWDVTATGEGRLPPGIEDGSVDIVVMIFIFSAVSPDQWQQSLRNVWNALKPGGIVLFRDYGRGDLAQVRFKKGRYLEENFYVRGDGTRVYFFEKDELEHIWSGGIFNDKSDASDNVDGLADQLQSVTVDEESKQPTSPRFEILNLGIDRRMLVNRQRRLKMYRCWMQGLFRKPAEDVERDAG